MAYSVSLESNIFGRLYYLQCIVVRSEKLGSLEVDGTNMIEGSSPGTMKHLTTDGTIFIGNSILHVVHLDTISCRYYVSCILLDFEQITKENSEFLESFYTE